MSVSPVAAGSTLKTRSGALIARLYGWLERRPLAHVAAGAALVLALSDVINDPSRVVNSLGDTDDATRLTQVRQLLAGQSWFDLSMPRFGGADPLISHWSRLIDLPLALLMLVFGGLFGQEMGETITRMAWPTLLSGVIIYVIARFCDREGDRKTALLAALLAACAMGRFQFSPGRIDHHNGMIIGAIGGTFLLLAALDRPRLGWWAGILLGLGCAIGYEGLALTALTLAVVVVASIWNGRDLSGLARAAVSFFLTLAVAHVGFGPYRPVGLYPCDALSLNLIILAASAAVGVALAHRARQRGHSSAVSFAFAAGGGVVGLALYLLQTPACIGGPMAEVDPRVNPVWLAYVVEAQSIVQIFREQGLAGALYVLYLPVALLYGVVVLRGRLMRHGELCFAAFLVAAILGCWQARLLPYASFLAVPLIAYGISRPAGVTIEPFRWPAFKPLQIAGIAGVGGLAVVLALALMLRNPASATIGVTRPSEHAATPKLSAEEASKRSAACATRDSISPLSRLPKGLAANDLDLGPYVVAHTHLDVMAAPYHRMGPSIMANHELFNGPVGQAEARLRAMGARYVVICEGVGRTIAQGTALADALRSELLAGRTPVFLEAVDLGATPIKVWQLKTP